MSSKTAWQTRWWRTRLAESRNEKNQERRKHTDMARRKWRMVGLHAARHVIGGSPHHENSCDWHSDFQAGQCPSTQWLATTCPTHPGTRNEASPSVVSPFPLPSICVSPSVVPFPSPSPFLPSPCLFQLYLSPSPLSHTPVYKQKSGYGGASENMCPPSCKIVLHLRLTTQRFTL